MRTEPYRWRLAVSASKHWLRQAMKHIEDRIEDIEACPENERELVDALESYRAVKDAYEKLRNGT